MTSRLVASSSIVLLVALSACAAVPKSPPADATQLRLPGLPWGATTPEVTAALVERGFRFAGRNAVGDLRFDAGELLGHDASLLARMHRDHLVKVVAFLEPEEPLRASSELDSIEEILRRFYGPPSEEQEPTANRVVWLNQRPDGRPFGVLLRTTQRRVYRLDLESPSWPDVFFEREMGTFLGAIIRPDET